MLWKKVSLDPIVKIMIRIHKTKTFEAITYIVFRLVNKVVFSAVTLVNLHE